MHIHDVFWLFNSKTMIFICRVLSTGSWQLFWAPYLLYFHVAFSEGIEAQKLNLRRLYKAFGHEASCQKKVQSWRAGVGTVAY